MDVSFEKTDGVPIARIAGDIDAANTEALEHRIVQNVSNEAFGVVLDMAGVDYLDSAGIRLLFQLQARLDIRQVRVVIVVPEGALINRTLEAVGAPSAIHVSRTIEDALAAVEASKQPPS